MIAMLSGIGRYRERQRALAGAVRRPDRPRHGSCCDKAAFRRTPAYVRPEPDRPANPFIVEQLFDLRHGHDFARHGFTPYPATLRLLYHCRQVPTGQGHSVVQSNARKGFCVKEPILSLFLEIVQPKKQSGKGCGITAAPSPQNRACAFQRTRLLHVHALTRVARKMRCLKRRTALWHRQSGRVSVPFTRVVVCSGVKLFPRLVVISGCHLISRAEHASPRQHPFRLGISPLPNEEEEPYPPGYAFPLPFGAAAFASWYFLAR